MNKASTEINDAWYACTAEGARDTVLREFQALSFKQKIQRLEEAEQTAAAFRLPPHPMSKVSG